MTTRLHTDREVLRCVYNLYEADYPAKGDPFLPIEIQRVADQLGCSPQLLFGRLHYDMGTRLRHRSPNDLIQTQASIFEVKAGERMHCVNFPYLASHLATLEHEEHRASRTFWLAVAAFEIAIFSFAFQVATPRGGTAVRVSDAVTQRQSRLRSLRGPRLGGMVHAVTE